jgi:hypothetical protein
MKKYNIMDHKEIGYGDMDWIHLAWSPTLNKEHKLEVFENKVLRKMFEPKKDELSVGYYIIRYFVIL